MGRKSSFRKGLELGERWPRVLRMGKDTSFELSADYVGMLRRVIKRSVPKGKITRQEFETGFRLGLKRGRR